MPKGKGHGSVKACAKAGGHVRTLKLGGKKHGGDYIHACWGPGEKFKASHIHHRHGKKK